MTCARCGGEHPGADCSSGAGGHGTGGHALLAFLDDFRSANVAPAEPEVDPLEAVPGYDRSKPSADHEPVPAAARTWESAAPGGSTSVPESPADWEPTAYPPPTANSAPPASGGVGADWPPPSNPAAAAPWPPPTGTAPSWQTPSSGWSQEWASPSAWSSPGPGPGPGSGRMLGRRRQALWGLVALALVGAAVAVALPRLRSGPTYPKAWDPRVTAIVQFVQTERGLTWKHPVQVEFMPPSQFDALMAKENAPDTSATQFGQTVFDGMRALGVASGNVDLARSAQQFAQADIVGQYVDSRRTVYVRGDTLTPYVRSVLAHELTHALQAQYFNLDKLRSGHQDDDSAVTALIEGDAVRVQNAYEQTLSSSDQSLLMEEQQQSSDQAQGSNQHDNIPQFMIDQAQFPYDFGPTFVAALVSKGGNAEVDAAFRNPPTLDSQIVDPDIYTPDGGAPSVTVPASPSGAHRIMPPSGFGQVTLLEMLGDQIGFGTAWPAVQSWQQDQWVPYSVHGQVCADLAVLNDSADSAGNLLQAGRAWAAHLPSATASRTGDMVFFHSCDPGASWKPAPNVGDPYDALAVRSVVLYQLITDGHLSPSTAGCAADQLMTSMGPKAMEAAEQATDPNSPAVLALRTGVRSAVQTCA